MISRGRNDLVELSKFLSLLLRHKPEILDLDMDSHGFVSMTELRRKIQRKQRWSWVAQKTIKKVVETDPKGRFEIKERKDRKYIRATYGHSEELPVTIDYPEIKSKRRKILYHGTKKRNLPSIRREGLKSKSRKYVHLSANKKEAVKVANRRQGENTILKILAREFIRKGGKIFKATPQLFLCKEVSPKYLVFPKEGTD